MKGTYHLGAQGDGVVALQHVLNGKNIFRRNFHAGPADGQFGPRTAQACEHAKWWAGYLKSSPEWGPFYGAHLDGILRGSIKRDAAMKAVSQSRHPRKPPAPTPFARESEILAKVVEFAKWAEAHKDLIHYAEIRPIPLNFKPGEFPKLPLTTDCSGFVTMAYHFAGAPDPNGLNYNGAGWTGTLLSHNHAVPLGQVRAGYPIVYSPYPGAHTAIVVEPGKDPMTISHGQEAGPQYVRVSQDGREPQTYLKPALW